MRYAISMFAAALLLSNAPAWSDESQAGRDAYNSADYEAALAAWQPLAESGDAGSQFGLGQMYGNGFGVMMDDALAIKWYGAAAEQGHPLAQNNLAVMYQNGWGVEQSDAEAMRLFSLAAEQGVVEAMLALGRFYAMDFSEDYDPVKAYKWLSVAEMMDSVDAGVKREALVVNMSTEQIATGDTQAAAWRDSHESLLANFN